MTNLLAIESTTLACSVALQHGQAVLHRHEVVQRTHAQLVLPWIEALLADAGIALTDLDGITFGAGPGGFTGIRIATGVVQAIALAHDLPVMPISSLQALAQWSMDQSGARQVITAQDAKMGQVYWAAYKAGQDGLAEVVIPDQLCEPTNMPAPAEGDWLAAGDAWQVYPAMLDACADVRLNESEIIYPHAQALLKIANKLLTNKQVVSAEHALPIYLRNKDAWKK